MKKSEINIRDPFILYENGTYYMYGTRGKGFGIKTGGFDVYMSADLEEWSEGHECFNSEEWCLNDGSNWAPEVHVWQGRYYMFASFQKPDGLRGTYILASDSPLGPFVMHSPEAVTPKGWECIDGTFYVENGEPYLVFCHEHTQAIDGTMCFIRLADDLKSSIGEPTTLFSASSPYYIEKNPDPDTHYATDGPYMFTTKTGTLLMLWSTYIKGNYAECLVRFENGSIKNDFCHIDPIIDDDGGHGMLFTADGELYLTFHTPNTTEEEHPAFIRVVDAGDRINKI